MRGERVGATQDSTWPALSSRFGCIIGGDLELSDIADEMVLEMAINGRADGIVTHNVRDFEPAAGGLGIEAILPAEALRRSRS